MLVTPVLVCCTALCSLLADCVAKLFAALRKCNDRIRLTGILNRCCAPLLVLESILLNLVAKIVLQHNRHQADMPQRESNVRFWGRSGRGATAAGASTGR